MVIGGCNLSRLIDGPTERQKNIDGSVGERNSNKGQMYDKATHLLIAVKRKDETPSKHYMTVT